MAKMLSLEHFKCVSTRSSGGREGTWVEVFDAIRDRLRRLNIRFNLFIANDDEISTSHHSGEFQKYSEKGLEAEDWSDVSVSLPLYLSRKPDMDEATRESSRGW